MSSSGEQETRAPTQSDLVRRVIEAARGGIHTVTLATIVSYDATKNPPRAIISLIPCSRSRDEDNVVSCHRVDPIANCPVLWPGAGDLFALTFPLVVGDTVAVLVAERSIAEWLQTGASQTEPRDPRRFDYSDAIVLPGMLHVAGAATADMHDAAAAVLFGAEWKLGSAAATKAVALAPEVAADLGTLKSAIDAGAAAAIVAGGDAAHWGAFTVGLAAGLVGWPAAVGATKVKAE